MTLKRLNVVSATACTVCNKHHHCKITTSAHGEHAITITTKALDVHLSVHLPAWSCRSCAREPVAALSRPSFLMVMGMTVYAPVAGMNWIGLNVCLCCMFSFARC
jgi:hypothetical protein